MYSINLLAYPGPIRALLRSRGTTSSRIFRDLECRTTPTKWLLAAFPVYRYDVKPYLFADASGKRRIDGTFGREGDRAHDSVSKHQRQLFFSLGCGAWKHGIAHRHPCFQQKSDLRVGSGDFHLCAVAVRAQQ